MLLGLMTFSAFVIDLGNWYFHVQHEQRGADSAALAGAVHLPLDVDGGVADSRSVLEQSGFDLSDPNITVDVHQVPGQPTQMYVSVTQTVSNIFLKLFGINHTTLARHAIAVYHAHLEFGSPDNILGSPAPLVDNKGGPANWENPNISGLQGQYWMQISSGGSIKANGARWSAGSCGPSENLNTGNPVGLAQNCDTSKPIPYANTDYDSQGDGIVLHIPAGVQGNIAVDLFDPEFLETGSDCNDDWVANLPQNNVPNIYAYNPFLGPYAKLPYCPGDRLEHGGTVPPPFTTTFKVYTPESSGSQLVSQCNTTYPGWMQGYNGTDVPTAVQNPSSNPLALVNLFHKWTRLCDFPVNNGHPTGDYVMRVTTPNWSAGTNDYAVRVAVMNGNTIDWAQTNRLQLGGDKSRLEIMTNGSNTVTKFFMGRIDPSDQGGTMTLEFYDIGDQSETVTVLPPVDATLNGVPMTSFSNCSTLDYGGNPAVPIKSTPAPNCSKSMADAQYNGKILGMKVPIPIGYSCGAAGNATDCWFRIQENYAKEGSIYDYVSFDGKFDDEGLRIIQ